MRKRSLIVWFWSASIVACGGRRLGAPPPPGEDALQGLAWFREAALAPAKQPPPTIDAFRVEAARAGAVGRAEWVLPEQAAWNQRDGGGGRLFNNRWAFVFRVEIEGAGAWQWDPGRTTLELNDESTVLSAAPVADDVLGDLVYWALQEERAALEGGLVARTRGAGPFRRAYLPSGPVNQALAGLVAFPAIEVDGLHVVAARLTLGVVRDGVSEDWVWVFD